MPGAFYAELMHSFWAKMVIDLTPGDGRFAFEALKARVGYLGITFTAEHSQFLEEHLLDLMKLEMCDSASPLFNSEYAVARGKKAPKAKATPAPDVDPKKEAQKQNLLPNAVLRSRSRLIPRLSQRRRLKPKRKARKDEDQEPEDEDAERSRRTKNQRKTTTTSGILSRHEQLHAASAASARCEAASALQAASAISLFGAASAINPTSPTFKPYHRLQLVPQHKVG